MKVSFWLGLVVALTNLHPLAEAWNGLGGTVRLAQTRFGILLPELAPLLMCACLAFVFDEQAILIAPWATAYSTMVIVWQTAAGGLVIMAMLAVILAAALWEVGFLVHAAIACAFLPLAAITTVTAGTTLARAEQVYGFVGANWPTLKQFVPVAFPHLPSDKYAAAAYTPMVSAGASGLMLSILLWLGALMHLRCAAIHLCIGPELWALQEQAHAAHARRLAEARRRSGAAQPGSADASAASEGVEVTWEVVWDALVVRLAGRHAHRFTIGHHHRAVATSSDVGASAYGGFSSGPAGSAAAYSSAPASSSFQDVPFDGAARDGSSSRGGFGSSSTASSEAMHSPTAAGGGAADPLDTFDGFRAAAYARRAGAVRKHKPVFTGGAVAGGGAGPAKQLGGFGSPLIEGAPILTAPDSRRGGAFSATYFSYLGPQLPEAELEARVEPVSCGHFTRAMRIEGVAAWVVHRTCILAFLVLSVASLAGLGGGLAVLELRGRCSVLARSAESVTYTTSFPLWEGNRNTIYITNEYPQGSIEIVAPHMDSRVNNFTLEVTSYAPSGGQLLSFDAFNTSANISNYAPQESDDDVNAGFKDVHIVFRPPPGAECVGLRIRISSVFFANYVIVSSNVFVNITGDLAEISDGVYTSKTFSSVDVTTGDGPVLLTNLHVEPSTIIDPAVGPPEGLIVRSRTGDVTLSGIFATRPTVTTGGIIRSSNVISTAPLLGCRTTTDGKIVPAVCGDLSYVATGSGRISVSQGLGGDNILLSTEGGEIVGTNTAVVAGHVVTLRSQSGPIFLATFIQATGNETFISTSGSISATGVFFNRLTVDARGDSKVTLIETFMGLGPPGILVVPNVTASIPFGDPLLSVRTDRGDIYAVGVGAGPAGSFAGFLSVDMASNLGNIKMEVSGGGFVGACSARRGGGGGGGRFRQSAPTLLHSRDATYSIAPSMRNRRQLHRRQRARRQLGGGQRRGRQP